MRDFIQAALDFVEAFETVFDEDWDHTRVSLGADTAEMGFIAPTGTFLKPGVEDESNNWGNRGYLLSMYRRLAALIDQPAQR